MVVYARMRNVIDIILKLLDLRTLILFLLIMEENLLSNLGSDKKVILREDDDVLSKL